MSSDRNTDAEASRPSDSTSPKSGDDAAPRTYLITGAAGFIGSHTARALLSRGHRVVIVDEFNAYYDVAIKEANVAALARDFAGQVTVHRGRIEEEAWLRGVFETEAPTHVIHLAARAGVRPSVEDPHLYVDANCHGTVSVLECCRAAGVRHLAMASSSSVYGENARMPFSEEDEVNGPVSPYAATKRFLELIAYTYSHLYGLSVSCLRFFTVYGESGRPDMAMFKFVSRIHAGQSIDVYGDGSTSRDYTYIGDIVNGIVRAADRALGYQIFNLGNGNPVSLSDMIACIERHVGRPAIINRMPMQPGDVPHTYADVSKARRLLGYEPSVPLDEGIRRTVAWYLDYVASKTAAADAADVDAGAGAVHDEEEDDAASLPPTPASDGDTEDSEEDERATDSPGLATVPAALPARVAAAAAAPRIHNVASSTSIASLGTTAARTVRTAHTRSELGIRVRRARRAAADDAPVIATATRLHSMPSLGPEATDRLLKFVSTAAASAAHVIVAVQADPARAGLVRDVHAAVQRARARLHGDAAEPCLAQLHVLEVTQWVGFSAALNAILRRAGQLSCSHLCLQSLEVAAAPDAVATLAGRVRSLRPDAAGAGTGPLGAVVCGARLPGHRFAAGEVEASGETCPWNTLAVWDVRRLLVTGFPPLADGLAALDTAARGVEEVPALALLQRVLGAENAGAELVELPAAMVTWETAWADEGRRKAHAAKVASKNERAQRQLDMVAGFSCGRPLRAIVQHLQVAGEGQ